MFVNGGKFEEHIREPGYGRKDRPNLDSEEVQHDVSPEKRTCSCCGKPYRRLGSSNRSKMIELVQQLFQVVDKTAFGDLNGDERSVGEAFF